MGYSLCDKRFLFYKILILFLKLILFYFLDINECTDRPCNGNEQCLNSFGSYRCYSSPTSFTESQIGLLAGTSAVSMTTIIIGCVLSSLSAIIVTTVLITIARKVSIYIYYKSKYY